MLRQLKRRLGQGGDTIIEVLVVLTVLGLAISISYATANRSLLNARQAQENTTATALAQSQIEKLRTMATAPITSSTLSPFAQTGPYCVGDDGNLSTDIDNKCVFDDGLYRVTATTDNSTSTIVVIVKWDNVLGQGQDSVTLSYRLHHQISFNSAKNSCKDITNPQNSKPDCLREVA